MTTDIKTDIYGSARESYLAQIDEIIANLNGAAEHPVHALRHHARASIHNGQFPDRKNEDWKYTSVRNILTQQYENEATVNAGVAWNDNIDAYQLTFVNGIFQPEQSDQLPDNIFFGPLDHEWNNTAITTILAGQLDKIMATPLSIFDAVAIGVTQVPYVLVVPAGEKLEKPIRMVHQCSTDSAAVQVTPVLLTTVGKHSEVEIMEVITGSPASNGSHLNMSHKLFVDAGAHCNIYRLQLAPMDARVVANTTVYQQQDSTAGIYSAELGAELMRKNIEVIHEGTNVTSNLYGVFIAGQGQHSDTQSFIDHALPHCQSNEHYKGVLTGNGRGVFNGKIIVRPDAQKTNAFQQNSTLILSKHAVMDSKPQLEIFADDVKCSHGATIGQLDEDALFYLRTRGLTPSQASQILQKAFVREVLEEFPNTKIAQMFIAHVDQAMNATAEA